jgi:CBS domain-containing protein
LLPDGIGSLVVTDDGRSTGKLLGLISEREIAHAYSRHGSEIAALPVGDVVTDPTVCSPGDMRRLMIMTEARVRHSPVTDDGHVIGT